MAKVGDKVANKTRRYIEAKIGKSIVTNENALSYQYERDILIENA